jgi:ribosomal protein S18 acetylase RimI-like enzyme
MAATHPPPDKVAALKARWRGQEHRLHAIARSLLAGEDWTEHLRGIPFVYEVPPLPGEALGRDLRGAPLGRWLHPEVGIRAATERDAALVAGIALEGLSNHTPLVDASPFPATTESAEDVVRSIRRGERFLLAACGDRAVGVVRWAERREFQDLTGGAVYAEVSGLSVLRSWRGLTIGRTLLRAAEEDARRAGLEVALLRTAEEIGLVPWYEGLGYAVRAVRQMTYPDAPTFLDVVLTRRLEAPTEPLRTSRVVRGASPAARP